MPYSTASALLDAARQYLDNTGASDAQLLNFLNTFMGRIQREHHFWFQEQVATRTLATSTSGFSRFSMPTDAIGVRRLFWVEDNKRKELTFTPFFDAIKVAPDPDTADKPERYSFYRNELYIFPNIASAITAELYYDRVIPDLVQTGSNDFLRFAPDVLLYGILSEYSHWMGEHQKAQYWEGKAQDAVNSLLKLHIVSAVKPASLVMRTPGTILQGPTASTRVSL